jgi:23S rRNA (cytidine1920-2'-O)/16S rRNA (cytidine1409-2'-O)-methyltransferase
MAVMLRRLDVVLVERGIATTRERAQALVAAGMVEVDGQQARSAAQRVGEAAELRTVGEGSPWASRAGEKLVAALDAFGVDCRGRVCLDAGASTGGFTDVLLSRGAGLIYAVDVGHGQLLPRLAADPRVSVLDRTNLRHLEAVPGTTPTLVTLDLSFISLRLVMPAVARVAPGAEVVALFKPQFELGREAVPRGGVVRDLAAAEAGAVAFLGWCAGELGASALEGPIPAPIRGARGNQELLVHFRLPAVPIPAQLGVSSMLRRRRLVGPPPVTHVSALSPSAARFLDLDGLGSAGDEAGPEPEGVQP